MAKIEDDKGHEQAHYRAVIKGGLKDGAIGLAAAGVGALALNRSSFTAWHRLTVPIKINIGAIIGIMSFYYGTDRASSDWAGSTGKVVEAKFKDEQWTDKAIDIFKENRWSIVGGSWVLGMLGSWLFINRQPLPFRQKIVQVRMYAQVITVGALGASVSVASIKTPSSVSVEEERERGVLREAARYRFKKDSEAGRRAQEALEHSHHRTDGSEKV